MISNMKFITVFFVAMVAFLFLPPGSKASVQEGDSLEGVTFPAPATQEAAEQLGLEKMEPFSLDNLDREYVLFKVVDVYCPVCHEQAPEFNRLFNRIQDNTSLAESMYIFTLAPEASPGEVEHLYQAWETPYPILGDHEYILPGKIGSLDTPYTIMVNREGKVVYAHGGVMPDTREMMGKLRELVK
ncbi:redoxin domain protein [Desulfonatronospira thiodismutans ASO3-1]|uniref:Redoxin domain protein n=1 Tax=Desulfonatronospira thiodismutans ASO3-1 TaxID=555779 RepID=D6SSQ1_9BACT|nr:MULTISPECIES: redoxin domain-containing protein [Desulfonatronospira]EFI33717.1 redoxin domain protein [Desulfonatronospira thiodismutans ASO3-1]RQD73553.1 MAG: hypothetical protein D5S03_12440 [Desulfonatronospira sp. MSAO_Bac3]